MKHPNNRTISKLGFEKAFIRIRLSLREKCPNTELFLVRVQSTGKYGPKKTPYLDTFQAVF